MGVLVFHSILSHSVNQILSPVLTKAVVGRLGEGDGRGGVGLKKIGQGPLRGRGTSNEGGIGTKGAEGV